MSVTRPASAQAQSFGLRPQDRVVFYGDSITEQSLYTWWTELYVTTRFPTLHAQFWGAGVGGDRVTGGGAGPVDQRLARDVFPHQPTVVTIMLGMNDGSYVPLTPAIEQAYAAGYEHILKSIGEHAPGARVVAIGPSPYDEVTRTEPLFPGGYNRTLLRFAEIDKRLAGQYGGSFTDANAPFNAALRRAAGEDRLAAQTLVPDRIHPEQAAHLLIAAALLRAWHAPALVSSTVIDGAGARDSGSSGAQVTEIRAEPRKLSWTSLEAALPMPLRDGNASLDLMKRSSGFVAEFNQELLLVRGLPSGEYRLQVDEMNAGSYRSEALAAGVNLAEANTPMHGQAQALGWAIRDKNSLESVQMRLRVRGSADETERGLDKVEAEMQQAIWSNAMPKPHRFILEAVAK